MYSFIAGEGGTLKIWRKMYTVRLNPKIFGISDRIIQSLKHSEGMELPTNSENFVRIVQGICVREVYICKFSKI